MDDKPPQRYTLIGFLTFVVMVQSVLLVLTRWSVADLQDRLSRTSKIDLTAPIPVDFSYDPRFDLVDSIPRPPEPGAATNLQSLLQIHAQFASELRTQVRALREKSSLYSALIDHHADEIDAANRRIAALKADSPDQTVSKLRADIRLLANQLDLETATRSNQVDVLWKNDSFIRSAGEHLDAAQRSFSNSLSRIDGNFSKQSAINLATEAQLDTLKLFRKNTDTQIDAIWTTLTNFQTGYYHAMGRLETVEKRLSIRPPTLP